jgi:large subunit ribosomal protein L7/L12
MRVRKETFLALSDSDHTRRVARRRPSPKFSFFFSFTSTCIELVVSQLSTSSYPYRQQTVSVRTSEMASFSSLQFARAAGKKAIAAIAGRPTNVARKIGYHNIPFCGVLHTQTGRFFSDGPAENMISAKEKAISSAKLDDLYNEITTLSEEEVNILGALVIQVLGRKIFPGEFGRGFEGVAAVPGDISAEEEEEKEVKTTFAIKLTGFDAKAKIKVIKEVRAIAGLGLKEAKELVESAPKVVIKDLSNDKAEEMKAQLEAVGAQVEID